MPYVVLTMLNPIIHIIILVLISSNYINSYLCVSISLGNVSCHTIPLGSFNLNVVIDIVDSCCCFYGSKTWL